MGLLLSTYTKINNLNLTHYIQYYQMQGFLGRNFTYSQHNLQIRVDILQPSTVEGIFCTDALGWVKFEHLIQELECWLGHLILKVLHDPPAVRLLGLHGAPAWQLDNVWPVCRGGCSTNSGDDIQLHGFSACLKHKDSSINSHEKGVCLNLSAMSVF